MNQNCLISKDTVGIKKFNLLTENHLTSVNDINS